MMRMPDREEIAYLAVKCCPIIGTEEVIGLLVDYIDPDLLMDLYADLADRIA